MERIELFDFQQVAADKLVDNALEYFAMPDISDGMPVPYVGQFKAVTGAGKTPILADVLGRISTAVILWTTKYGSVVDQTVANLKSSGKYHHLLGSAKKVDVINFREIQSLTQWRRILEATDGVTILVSTVAAWFSNEKDDRLNVHKATVGGDWGDISRWEQLRTERSRPLWVVYDEAHNTTTEQIEQLIELDPAGFFVASASPIKGKLNQILSNLSEATRKKRIIPISTRAVVDAQLLKSTIALADYDSSSEEMISEVVARRQLLEDGFSTLDASIIPKAIYVVETSNVTANGAEPRPNVIWRFLVDNCQVDPEHIAVCTNTKSLPKDAISVTNIDQLSDTFTHIIFNKKLQEGWDDPSVYVCYFDGKTDSSTRIQQVIGRALRQPKATHLSDEELNTAYFFINCPTEALEKITDQLKEELRIYKSDDVEDDFEPFQIKQERSIPPKIPIKPEYEGKLEVPVLQLEIPTIDGLKKYIQDETLEYGDGDLSAPGKAMVNIVSVKTGVVSQNSRDLLEDMRVRCGAYLQENIRKLSKNCANSLPTSIFSNAKLDKSACYNSKALNHYHKIAVEVVKRYENHVQLTKNVVSTDGNYIAGAYQPSSSVMKEFDNAGHPHYDRKAFNDDEFEMAKALDKYTDYIWVRNKQNRDYGIPLPTKSETSSNFFPDFLWWVNNTVWAIDPTGKFIVNEKLRTKLLVVPDPLKIALVIRDKWDLASNRKIDSTGWTLARHRLGNSEPELFDSLDELLKTLIAVS